MKFFCRGLFFWALMSFALNSQAQRDFSEVTVSRERVAENLYVLVGAGGNIGLSVGEDGPLLIDAQYAPLSGRIMDSVSELSDRPVRFVINTHWHGDHTGGNENFAKAGAIIVAHDNVRQRMTSEQFVALFDHRAPPSPAAALPRVTFSATATFHWNGDTIRATHVQHAHTDGDAIVHFVEDKVFHMGDTFWTSGFPRIDAGNGGTVQGVIRAARQVLAMADDGSQIVPGHGPVPPVGLDALRSYVSMLEQVVARVSALTAQGLSEAEVVAAAPTREFDEKWGQAYVKPETFTRSVYRSLEGK